MNTSISLGPSFTQKQETLQNIPAHNSVEQIIDDIQAFDGAEIYTNFVLFLLNNGSQSITAYSRHSNPGEIKNNTFLINEYPTAAEVLDTHQSHQIPAGTLPPAIEAAFNLGEQGTYLLCAIHFYDQPLGLLALENPTGKFTAADIQKGQLLAKHAAFRLGSEKLLAENQRKTTHLEIIRKASKNVNSNLELDSLLQEVVKLIRETLGYYHVHIFLVDGPANQIVLQELIGERGELIRKEGLRFEIGSKAMTAWVAVHGEKRVANDISKDPQYFFHSLLPNVKSEASFPMRVGDIIVGVLDVQSQRLNAFREDDIFTLQIIADQTAIGIENAYLFEETRRQVEIYTALHDISMQITSRLENNNVLNEILKQAAKLLNTRATTLGILNEEKGTVLLTAGFNTEPGVVGTELEIGEGVAGRVIETRAPVLVNQYIGWKYGSHKFKETTFNAVLGVPLWRNEQIIGTLVALDYQHQRPFTTADAKKLSLFANFASIALGKSELFDQIRTARQDLKKQVKKRTIELSEAQADLLVKAEELRHLLEATVNIQEEERARIALDLHDGSNQLITGILFEIQAAEQSIINNRLELSIKKLERTKELLRVMESENRRIIAGLRPTILDVNGLVPAIRWFSEEQSAIYNVPIYLRVKGNIISLRKEVETAAFRILQESFHNAFSHAHANTIQVRVEYSTEYFRLKIIDDGIGFDFKLNKDEYKTRLGLIGMKERAQSIGGTLLLESKPGNGVKVTLSVPF